MRKILLAGVLSLTVSPLFAARPLAAWDVVPYQRVDGTFAAGVVAFHDKAVKVEFTINGKKFGKAVESPSLNPRTGVEEFVLQFPAGKLSEKLGDRAFSLGANVVVEGEEPYKLQPLKIYANGRGTLGSPKTIWVDSENGNEFAPGDAASPVKTLARAVKMVGDGGTVYLKSGTYDIELLGGGFARKYWTVVTPAPGVERNTVKVFSGRPGTEKLHFKNINFYCDSDSGDCASIVMGEDGKTSAWFDNCIFTNLKGRHAGEAYPFGNKLIAYVTGGATYDMTAGSPAVLLRNHTFKSVARKPIANGKSLVVNCKIDDVKPAEGTTSAELLTLSANSPAWTGDLIVYGLKASNVACRVFSLRRLRDSAFVNVVFDDVAAQDGIFSIAAEAVENVLFVNFSLLGQELRLAHSKEGRYDFKPVDVVMKKCNFDVISGCVSHDGSKGFDLRDSKVKTITK